MRRWCIGVCVLLVHWIVLLFLFLESWPDNYNVAWGTDRRYQKYLIFIYLYCYIYILYIYIYYILSCDLHEFSFYSKSTLIISI